MLWWWLTGAAGRAMARKLNFEDPIVWWHHRGGWRSIVQALAERLHDPRGVLCHTYADSLLAWKSRLPSPWVGFLHGPVRTIEGMESQYKHPWSLEAFFSDESCHDVLSECLGLFTFSSHTRRYVEARAKCPVYNLTYPAVFVDRPFSVDRFLKNPDKKLLLIGHWLRRWQDFYDLRTVALQKCLLKGADVDYDSLEESFRLRVDSNVRILPRVADEEYDRLLSENIVFLPLHDVAAATVLVECIVRNTPVLLNRLEGHGDYLPDDYPYYYDTLEEAAFKADDLRTVIRAHECLRDLPKRRFAIDSFVRAFVDSPTYRRLPVPY